MNIAEKLSAMQRELLAPKTQFNSFGKYSYRSCEDILEALKPLMKKYKTAIIITDDVKEVGGRCYVVATANLIDTENSDEDRAATISTTAWAREPEEKKGMDESQITGTASSYARKYALNGLFAIDDVQDADARAERAKKAKELTDEEKREKAMALKKISLATATALAARCNAEGVSAGKLCTLYRVGSIEDITNQMHRNICDHWDEVKEACHE